MLKSLELIGFKSFADRIRFDFASGITGVVGPNGSGKSNVVDSIKWILGDQSAKSLRGKEMTDVIFNGASGRKPSALAEATLTFDNSSGFLPVDRAEVQIGRRIYRSGEAEYLINNEPARLKDVRDLFLGTGAGSSSYCIIEQGRVDQILQANASTRRLVFEEAAGISRYKTRKLDAERKLERVDQNVARLTDIVDEVQAQLNSIRSQAVKAAKYRQVSEELRELWLGLAADQFRDFEERLAAVERRATDERTALEACTARQAEIDARLAEVDSAIAAVDERLRETERRRSVFREEAARHEATVRHQTARLREMDADLVRLRRQRASIDARRRDAHAKIADAREQAAHFQRDLATRRETIENQARQIGELAANADDRRRELETHRQQALEAERRLTDAAHRAASLESQAQQHRSAALQAEERLRQLEELCRRSAEERNAAQAKAAAAAEEATRSEAALGALQRDRLALAGVHEQFHKTLAERRERRSAWRARKGVLEDFENREVGLGIGVKEILGRARSARSLPWNLVLGSVTELLDVDLEHAALVEIALGRRAQTIVIERLGPLVDFLEHPTAPLAGRVAFLALQDDRGGTPPPEAPGRIDPSSVPDLRQQPGVQFRADSIVRSSDKAPWLAAQLLCDTWIVDTIESALALAAGAGRGCRFVTLQGELIDTDGTVTAGTLRGETTLVSHRSELRRLRLDLERIDREIGEDERKLEEMLASLSQADAELEAAQSSLQAAAAHQAQCRLELAETERELDRLDVERTACAERYKDQRDRLAETTAQVELARTEVAAMEAEIESARRHIAEREAGKAALDERLADQQRSLAQAQLELAKSEERFDALRQAHERLVHDSRQYDQQAEEAERRVQQVVLDRRRVALHLLNTNSSLAASFLQSEKLAQAAAQILAEKDAMRARRGEWLRDEAQVRDERRAVGERLHALELEGRELQHQIDGLCQRIDEEYQVRLADAVAAGASALKLAREDGPSEAGTPDAGPSDDGPDDIRLEDVREELEARVNRLRRQLKLMGNVNSESLRDLDEMERRFAHLSDQLADLVEAKKTLEEILRRISGESKRLFTESFASIRSHFQELFRKFFGGGEGDIVLEDPQDVLECGIEIVARPPGKELRSISLLSGGEKTLTAVALLLAIFKSRPSPFCILDEVDAALDEANVERFAAVIREFKQTTQFIVITHSKRTMAAADVLYGVTMEESGVSKRLSVRFDDVDENGEIRAAAGRRTRDAA